MKHFFNAILIGGLLFSQTTVSANDSTVDTQHNKAGMGFSLGALIGGLIAGPPGLVIGAASGGLFGSNEDEHDKIVADLETELNAKSIELAYQQNELAKTKAKFENEFKQVMLNKEIRNLQTLSKGIAYVIYFKTNDATINHDIISRIEQLAALIKPHPRIQVRIEGFADARGNDSFNLTLSKNRINSVRHALINAGMPNKRIQTQAFGESHAKATEGDLEEYIYDRRVTINLTLDREV